MEQEDIRLVELPSYRVFAVGGPMEQAEDAHPVHRKFARALDALPARKALQAIKTHRGQPALSGALVYGDYSEPEPKMSMFKQVAFLDQEQIEKKELDGLLSFDNERIDGAGLEYTPPGLYATFRHEGEYSSIHPAVRQIMYKTLPQHGLKHSGGPLLEIYHDGLSSEEGRHVTEICVPVEPRQ